MKTLTKSPQKPSGAGTVPSLISISLGEPQGSGKTSLQLAGRGLLREQHALFNRDLTPLTLLPAATADVRRRGYSQHGGAAAAGFTAPACSTAQLHTWESKPIKKCLTGRTTPWHHSRLEIFLFFLFVCFSCCCCCHKHTFSYFFFLVKPDAVLKANLLFGSTVTMELLRTLWGSTAKGWNRTDHARAQLTESC